MIHDTILISQCGRFSVRIHPLYLKWNEYWFITETGKIYLSQTFAIKNARMILSEKRKKNPLKKKKEKIKVKRKIKEKNVWREVKIYDIQF